MPFLTIIVTVFIFGILVLTHEFFHFIAAKRSGVKVEEFGIGYPPRLIGIFKKGKKWEIIFGSKGIETETTIYSLNFIPFGGFNKIYGMEEESSAIVNKALSFRKKSIGTRAKIIVAGVAGNFLLAVFLFGVGFYFGFPQVIEGKAPKEAKDVGVQIISVNKDSPAQAADIKIGDKIIQLRSFLPVTEESGSEVKIVQEVNDIQEFTQEHLGEKIILTIKRGDKILEKEIIPRENPPEGEGSMGVGLVKVGIISYPWYSAFLKGIEHTFILAGTMIEVFFHLIKGVLIGKPLPGVEFAGPIGVTLLISDMLEIGWIYVLNFTAILSLNLTILNLLPFPALDGGYLLLLLIEKIRKAPVKIEIENLINQIGFVMLIILMIIVTVKDIGRLF